MHIITVVQYAIDGLYVELRLLIFAIVTEAITIPVAIGRYIEFPVTRNTPGCDKQLETGVLPQLVLAHGFRDRVWPLDLIKGIRHVVLDVEYIIRTPDVTGQQNLPGRCLSIFMEGNQFKRVLWHDWMISLYKTFIVQDFLLSLMIDDNAH